MVTLSSGVLRKQQTKDSHIIMLVPVACYVFWYSNVSAMLQHYHAHCMIITIGGLA